MRKLIFGLLATIALVGTAHADTAAYEAKQLAKYERYAGAPVDEFNMVSLYQWQVVGPTKVVVWPRLNDAYLITVDEPCRSLQLTDSLGLTQEMAMKVTTKFDFVGFAHQRCKIVQIRPIDYKAMRAAEKGEKTTKSAKAGSKE